MLFASIRIITSDVDRLTTFYEKVTGLTAHRLNPVFAQIATGAGTVALAGPQTLAATGTPGIADPGTNRSVLIEFRVDDVDAEFARLADGIVSGFELEPTTMPWGNRSILFRDPDGNLVNLFTPVSAEARARSGS